jgi:hypothetical protein
MKFLLGINEAKNVLLWGLFGVGTLEYAVT